MLSVKFNLSSTNAFNLDKVRIWHLVKDYPSDHYVHRRYTIGIRIGYAGVPTRFVCLQTPPTCGI